MLRKPLFLADLALFVLCSICALAQHAPSASSDQVWNDLAAGNQRFVMGKAAPHDFPSQRKALTKTQHPQVAVLSCSDSRVPPELVFDAGLGDLFVVRSAGEDDDPLSLGSLEYAIEHLGSTVIVVLDTKLWRRDRGLLRREVGVGQSRCRPDSHRGFVRQDGQPTPGPRGGSGTTSWTTSGRPGRLPRPGRSAAAVPPRTCWRR